MNVIMIRSNPIDPDVRLEKEAKTLAGAGYNVTLIGWQRFGEAPEYESTPYYDIRRIKLRAPFEKKVIFYLPIWWTLAFYRLLKEDWDIIHAADFDTYLPALIAAKIKRKRIVYDIFDFYADQVPLPTIIWKCVAKIDTSLMRSADAVIVVDQSRLRQIGREGDETVHIIYNSPQDESISLTDRSLNRGGVPFTIFFAGVLTQGRDFETVIRAAKEVGDIQIDLAGFGCDEDKVRSMSERESHVTFLGRLPYNEVIRRTLQSDLLFALYDPGVPNNRYASPNKLFEAMMCGKPILVSDETSMAEIVRKEDCGVVVPYRDVSAIKHAIRMLRSDPTLCKRLGENGRRAYETKYSWGIMEGRLLHLYSDLSPGQS